jgi:hypothetical protein
MISGTSNPSLGLVVGDFLPAVELIESLLHLGNEAQPLDGILNGGIIREALNRLESSLFFCHAEPPKPPIWALGYSDPASVAIRGMRMRLLPHVFEPVP